MKLRKFKYNRDKNKYFLLKKREKNEEFCPSWAMTRGSVILL